MVKKMIYWIITGICILTMVYSGIQLIRIGLEYKAGKDYYNGAVSEYVSSGEPDAEKNTKGNSGKNETVAPISVNFDDLCRDYPDVIGWLYCEDTPINYPILQGKDNEKYLNHLMDGSYDKAGSLFLDYRCSKDFTSYNSIIYGHKRKDRSMFGSLEKYKKQDYYDAHPVFWLLTPEQNYRSPLIAAYTIPENDAFYNSIDEEADISKYVKRALKNSTFRSDYDISDLDRIISFSTCAYDYEGARFVVIGSCVPTS